jgi:hypothetical protein
MYDVLHLAGVLGQGYRPTGGEMAWATIDGCFVIADVLSLLALQPQATAASEAARTQVKVAAREAVETLGEEVAERVAKPLGKSVGREVAQRAAKWWAVRKAGGTYELLRRLPEAMGNLAPAEIANMGRAICAKAGIRLSTFAPVRFVVQGKELIRRFPAERGLKYVVLQCTQASVGILGVQKMEEHLRSRRPATREDNPS